MATGICFSFNCTVSMSVSARRRRRCCSRRTVPVAASFVFASFALIDRVARVIHIVWIPVVLFRWRIFGQHFALFLESERMRQPCVTVQFIIVIVADGFVGGIWCCRLGYAALDGFQLRLEFFQQLEGKLFSAKFFWIKSISYSTHVTTANIIYIDIDTFDCLSSEYLSSNCCTFVAQTGTLRPYRFAVLLLCAIYLHQR